jgi:hypothetical protein
MAWDHAIANEDPSKGLNRGEFGGTCLQHEANDQDHGSARNVAGHRDLTITKIAAPLAGRSTSVVAERSPATSFYTASVESRLIMQ